VKKQTTDVGLLYLRPAPNITRQKIYIEGMGQSQNTAVL